MSLLNICTSSNSSTTFFVNGTGIANCGRIFSLRTSAKTYSCSMISSNTSTAPNRQRITIISTHIITNGQAGIILNILKNHSVDLSDAVQLTFAIAFVNARGILRPLAAKIRVGVCGISQRHDAVVAACGRARTVADDRHNDSFFFPGVRFTAGFAVRCFCVLCVLCFFCFPGRRRFRLH